MAVQQELNHAQQHLFIASCVVLNDQTFIGVGVLECDLQLDVPAQDFAGHWFGQGEAEIALALLLLHLHNDQALALAGHCHQCGITSAGRAPTYVASCLARFAGGGLLLEALRFLGGASFASSMAQAI